MILIETLFRTEDYGQFIHKLLSQIKTPASLILEGPMGAGKTTFTSHFCKYFNLNLIQSPTFSIHNRYQNSKILIDHFDLYRLESEDEIEASGFFDLLDEPADYKIIEWGERVNTHHWPVGKTVYRLKITVNSDGSRTLTCSGLQR